MTYSDGNKQTQAVAEWISDIVNASADESISLCIAFNIRTFIPGKLTVVLTYEKQPSVTGIHVTRLQNLVDASYGDEHLFGLLQMKLDHVSKLQVRHSKSRASFRSED